MTERRSFFNAILITCVFLIICWAFFLLEDVNAIHIKQYGLQPRKAQGIIGIISMHFLHGDWKHIGQNSMAFLVLNSFLFYFYRQIALKVFLAITFIGAGLLWIWGGGGNHIGASLIIYGLASFLFFSGLIRSNEKLTRVALFVAFYYGSIVWYVLPIDPHISWEGHLSGAAVGLVCAIIYRTDGPQRKKYQWEIDEEREAMENMESGDGNTSITQKIEVKYHYGEEQDDSETDLEE